MECTIANIRTAEVTNRRRKYGLNQMKEEKENLILKFFVCLTPPSLSTYAGTSNKFLTGFLCWSHSIRHGGCCCPCRWSGRLG